MSERAAIADVDHDLTLVVIALGFAFITVVMVRQDIDRIRREQLKLRGAREAAQEQKAGALRELDDARERLATAERERDDLRRRLGTPEIGD